MTAARSEIAKVLPVWPGRGSPGVRARAMAGGRVGSLSARHAERVWEQAREEGYRQWFKLGRPSGRAGGDAVDLVFIGQIALHVTRCERCARVSRADGSEAAGVTGDTPSEWLRWAVWQVPALRDVARAVGLPQRNRPPWASIRDRAGVVVPLPVAPVAVDNRSEAERAAASRAEWQRLINSPRGRAGRSWHEGLPFRG